MSGIKELSKLSDEDLRVRCAEVLGATKIHDSAVIASFGDGCGDGLCGLFPGRTVHEWIPEYSADLNAMHEAEKMLRSGLWTSYENCLMKLSKAELIATGVPGVDAARICTIGATARQRCIAFIAVMEGGAL